ncbi:MAG: hypothetical protein IPI46_14235 [Bacteroidetes bacterium]|nr:hypothetical protein [Bacteroidota bacterium]
MILITICFVIAFLCSAFLSGRSNRSYQVMDSSNKIMLPSGTLTLHEFASKFKPILYSSPKFHPQTILWTWYEVVEKNDYYDIVYYHCWENEINPNQSFNIVYKIFRTVYFGYPLYDIEYLQVRISKSTGEVLKSKYETSVDVNYQQRIVKHSRAELVRATEESFVETIFGKDGSILKTDTLHGKFKCL